ncbi:MAG: MBL fold metallo-hydrolase, partial [Rhodospirillales bacterium]|nr:MBL fold metallo-hydrolase [Rhodospirillales bacterium]
MGTALAAPLLARAAVAQVPAPAAPAMAPGFYRFKLGQFTVTTIY